MLNLSRHRWLRCTLCILLAVVVAFMPTVRAYAVVATTTTATILVVGTILTALGVSFATTDALQRGALSFYNSLTGTARTFIHDAVNSYQISGPGGKWIMTLGVGMALMFSKLIADFFPKSQTEKEDTSAGAVGEDGTALPPVDLSQNWQRFVGKTLGDFIDIQSNGSLNTSCGFPLPLILNDTFNTSDVDAVGAFVPIVLRDPLLKEFTYSTSRTGWGRADYEASSPAVLTDNKDAVFRFVSPMGETIDYQFRLSFFLRKGVSYSYPYFELLESCGGGDFVNRFVNNMDSVSDKLRIGARVYSMGAYFNFINNSMNIGMRFEFIDDKNNLGSNPWITTLGPLSIPTGLAVSRSCVLVGLVDRKTGEGIGDDVLPVPYIPDASISANPAVTDALQKELDKDKDAGISVGVPAVPDDLVGRTWPDVWTESQIKDLIKDAIEESTTNPPDPGGGGGDSGGGTFPPPAFVPVDMLFKAFPFCIPLDLAAVLGALVADPVAPRFVIPFNVGDVINNEIVLDLTEWEPVVKIIREGEYILFLIGLALLTFTARKV